MKFKIFGHKIILKIEKGEELVQTIKKIAAEQDIKLASISGIGAVKNLKVGSFDVDTKEYHAKELDGCFEVCPLTGNISTMDKKTYLHAHINACDKDFRSFGGHLDSAVCSATFEAIINVIDGEVDRKFSEEIGLNLYEF
ncbi:MAG: PPC domain-containing DNA-binding protein [Nanoarchaeota archaeon]